MSDCGSTENNPKLPGYPQSVLDVPLCTVPLAETSKTGSTQYYVQSVSISRDWSRIGQIYFTMSRWDPAMVLFYTR